MNKFLLHLFFGILMVFDYLFLLIKMQFKLPKLVYDEVMRAFRFELTKMPLKLRKHFPYFDSLNLRYHIDHLKTIRVEEMIHWPSEEQAEYADQIAVNFVKEGRKIEIDTTDLHYININATSIGNGAYIFLHHPDISEREKALVMLNHMEKLIQQANN